MPIKVIKNEHSKTATLVSELAYIAKRDEESLWSFEKLFGSEYKDVHYVIVGILKHNPTEYYLKFFSTKDERDKVFDELVSEMGG